MKKVLMVSLPWLGHEYAGREGMRWAYTSDKKPIISFRPFPFYMAYTSKILKKAGHMVLVWDCLAENLSFTKLKEMISEIEFDYLIAETHTPSYNNDIKIVSEIKQLRPKMKIVLAGPHATALPDEVLENECVDHVLVGEYEFLAKELVDGKVDSKKIIQKELPDIDSYPWPDREELNIKNYNETFCDNYPNIHILTSRGCPYSCSYCNCFMMSGRKTRYRNPMDVLNEMNECNYRFKPREFWLEDDNINSNESKFIELMEAIREAKVGVPFKAMGHVSISRNALEIFKEAGGNGLKFGVESADNGILRRLRKGITIEMVEQTIKNCKELGIKTHLTYCIGLPGDTEETIKKTIEFAKKNGDSYQISLAAPFPGTPLYDEAKREGWLNIASWDDFNGLNDATLTYPNLNSKRIYELYQSGQQFTYKKAMKEWRKWIRMIYQERGIKGLFKLITRTDIIKSILK